MTRMRAAVGTAAFVAVLATHVASAQNEPERRGRRTADSRVNIGGGVRIETGEVVDGDVVAIGGGVYIDGRVTGDVVAIGGGAELGPHAEVSRDVTVVGGRLTRDPAARIDGKVSEVAIGGVNVSSRRWGAWPFNRAQRGGALRSLFAFLFTVTRLAVLCILSSVVLLLGREYVERVGFRAVAEPVKAGVVGVLIQLLFFPVLIVTIALMVVTIIGIPLLLLVPFAVLALVVFFLVGFTAVASHVGRRVVARFGWRQQSPYLVATTGTVVLLTPMLLARLVGLIGGVFAPLSWTLLFVGILAEYVAWTVGLGAVALLRFDGTRPLQPAAVPHQAT